MIENYTRGNDMHYIDIPDMEEERNRVKMCYAFLKSSRFYHQEICIFNPKPKHYDPRYVFPRDCFLISYSAESNDTPPSLEKVADTLHEAKTLCSCIGSHRPDMDRTVQLLCFPEALDGDKMIRGRKLLIIQYLQEMSDNEKDAIIDKLIDAYHDLEE